MCRLKIEANVYQLQAKKLPKTKCKQFSSTILQVWPISKIKELRTSEYPKKKKKKHSRLLPVKRNGGKFLRHIFPIKCWKRTLTEKCNPAPAPDPYSLSVPKCKFHGLIWSAWSGVRPGTGNGWVWFSITVRRHSPPLPTFPLKLHCTSQTSGFHTTDCFHEVSQNWKYWDRTGYSLSYWHFVFEGKNGATATLNTQTYTVCAWHFNYT